MERLTERSGYHIRIKGCKTLYPDWKRKGAYLNNAIVQLCAYEDAQEQAMNSKLLDIPSDENPYKDMTRAQFIEMLVDNGCEIVFPRPSEATRAKSMRLIDANALLFTTLTDGGHWSKDVVYKADIANAPTIDPIHAAGGCYCRECKFRTGHGSCGHPRHEVLPSVYPNDFCSYGERQEGEDNG